MVRWVASLVVIADGVASTELSSLFCELCFICAFDMYMCVFCAVCLCVFLVCTHAQGCLAMNELFDELRPSLTEFHHWVVLFIGLSSC